MATSKNPHRMTMRDMMAPVPGARRRATTKRALALGVLLPALVGLTGCSETPAPQTVVVTPTVVAYGDVAAVRTNPPKPHIAKLWPLTGVPTTKLVKRPALSVKIENSTDARPQTGLEGADLVWEEVVEGGITRYIATYHSHLPKEIGPVRSVRPMDAPIIGSLGGMLAYSGGQRPFIDRLGTVGIQSVVPTVAGGGFYRVSFRYAPHNMYASPSQLLARASKGHTAPPKQQFVYAEDAASSTAATSGKPADKVAVTLTQVGHPNWAWDEASETYLRSEGSTPAVSANGTQFSASNVVTMRVSIETTRYRDPAGSSVPETIVVGSGDALVASGGKAIEAKWSKKSATAPFVLTVDGTDVELAPGKTWIELMPTSGSWSIAR